MPGDFLDSNVLIYLLEEDEERATAATQLVEAGGTISAQVLNEIAAVTLRKRPGEWPRLFSFLMTVSGLLKVEPLTLETHLLGLELITRHRLAVYDAMIVAAALLADCDILWTEDMQDGLVIDGRLTLRNPFANR